MQAMTVGTDDDSRQLDQLRDAERLVIDAIVAARQSIACCEQALQTLAEARSRLARERDVPRYTAPHRASPLLILSGSGHDDGQPAWHPAGDLTVREGEVLRLIAAGQSNRQIADTLFLSPRTIERHIANIYLKIDAHSKAEATAYARRNNIV